MGKMFYIGLCIGFLIGIVVLAFVFHDMAPAERSAVLKVIIPFAGFLVAIPTFLFLRRRNWRYKARGGDKVLQQLYKKYSLRAVDTEHPRHLPAAAGKIHGIGIETLEEDRTFYIRFVPKVPFPVYFMICSDSRWDLDKEYLEEEVPGLPENWHCYAKKKGILYSALDEATKQNFSELAPLAHYICLVDDDMYVYPHSDTLRSLADLETLVETSLKIMESTQNAAAFWERLQETALTAPEAQQREQAVRFLGESVFQHDLEQSKRRTLQAAMNDEDVSVQIAAARCLGQEGMEHIKKLAEQAAALDSPRQQKLADVFFHYGVKKYSHSLLLLFQHACEDGLRIRILKQFGEQPIKKMAQLDSIQAWSPVLIPYLETKNAKLLSAVIDALGNMGQLEAVEPLYRLTKSTINPRTDQAANQAIAAIQARHGTGDEGWLSVEGVPAEAGGLSMDERAAHGGELSSGEAGKE